MLPVSLAVSPKSSSFVFIDTNSFSKDGRKIKVGDCALFEPNHNSLPFIGRICKLIRGEVNSVSLSVSWLYRPADVKLKDGALLEAAPNEVFYSFHRDEIPAASLLHQCKVTFLRKGELPSGISSFVCGRVYDIEAKCLWWLTDKNYINERQVEVDQLLDKTQIEMHGAAQTGGRSPKPVNGPNGSAQLKPSSDNVQNSSSSISSHTKSKKRELGVHNIESVKRERLSKVDDADSGQLRPEDIIKTEIAKITDKGGLVDFGGVEKLIQLMRPDSTEKKLNLAGRTMLVNVISVTDRFDCLGRFVQLRGLSVLDEWLQEIHKGKIGDGSPKVTDKSIEEFLFALLRALDRLPVNLHALQTCNVGKSVNHLRSHKNTEIQKKARGLVNTWKRRVEAEMNILQTKSGTSTGGSWPNKSMMSEVSPMGSRRMGGSDAAPNSPATQPSAPKAQQPKHSSGEAVTKSQTSPGSTKLSTLSATGAGSSDMPSSATKDGRSCSSSQSPNHSQSCSSDQGKNGASCREDARSSAVGSSSASKISISVSHSKSLSNGFHGSTVPGVQKEGKLGSLNRNFASEKGSPTTHTSERVSDVSLVDNGNTQRLIVRLPNTNRSPARNASVESPQDSSTVSGKGSLLIPSEKQDHHDQKASEKIDTAQGSDVPSMARDLSHGKDEAKVAPVGERTNEAACGSGPSSGVTPKPGKLYEASYSSINALVESCAKFSEASVSPSVGDDVGMNLLASVAAGEMSTSDASPALSPGNISVANGHIISGDSKDVSFGCEAKTGEDNTHSNPHSSVKAPEVKPAGSMDDASGISVDAKRGCKEEDKFADDKPTKNNVILPDSAAIIAKAETHINEESASWSSSDMHKDEKKLVHRRSSSRHTVSPDEPHVATTSCGGADLSPKFEVDDDTKAGIHSEQNDRQNMDSGTSVSQYNNEQKDTQNMDAGGTAPTDNPPMQNVRSCDEAHGRNTVSTPVVEMSVKLDFDLNEVFPSDDGFQAEVESSSIPGSSAAVHTPSTLPSSISPVNGNRPALITIAAAAKGPFYPSENLLRGKSELGWKGSAATSAFRPAEPRKVMEVPLTTSDSRASKQARPLFDFDLNVGVVEDAGLNNAPSMRSVNNALSGGGLDLDLNACEENPEVVQLSFSSSSRQGISQFPSRSLLPGGFSHSEPSSSRGFDLNNGPGGEDVGGESVSFSKSGMQFMSAVPNVRMNNMDIGNFSTWFPPNHTYPTITIPSIIPGRGEQSYPVVPSAASQRMLSPVTASTSLNPEMFRGPVLSSSPAVAFPSSAPFQYSAFPFDTSFPLPSSSSVSAAYVDSSSSGGPLCFPTMPSQAQQLMGPNGVVSMPYRPYFMSLPGGPSNVGPDARKWASQGLDLNAGPGVGVIDDKSLRQLQIHSAGSQGLADEQLKMYQQMAANSGVSKRKDPDGGWDGDRISYKHPSWQ